MMFLFILFTKTVQIGLWDTSESEGPESDEIHFLQKLPDFIHIFVYFPKFRFLFKHTRNVSHNIHKSKLWKQFLKLGESFSPSMLKN